MTRIAVVVFVGLALTLTSGCMMEMEDDPETAEVESAVMILPVAGTWDYGETSTVSTTCNANLSHIEDGAFEIGSITTQAFTVTAHDGTAPFVCKSNTTEGFSCPNRASMFFDFRRFFDARVTVQAIAKGQFLDTRHARGKQDAILTCVGRQCNLIGPNPCGFTVSFEVHHM